MSLRGLPQLAGVDHVGALAHLREVAGSAVQALLLGQPHPRNGPMRVRDLVTLGPAYVRVMHPLQRRDRTLALPELARWDAFGTVHQDEDLRQFLRRLDATSSIEPLIGAWPATVASQVASLLEDLEVPFIDLAFWAGDGFYELASAAQDHDQTIFRGAPEALRHLDHKDSEGGLRSTPSLVWSREPVIVIATHPDCTSTYLSGSPLIIEALDRTDLEWQPVSPGAFADDWTRLVDG